MKTECLIDDLTGLPGDATGLFHEIQSRPYNSPVHLGAGRFFIRFFWQSNPFDEPEEAHLSVDSISLILRDWVRQPKEKPPTKDGGIDVTPAPTGNEPPGQPTGNEGGTGGGKPEKVEKTV